MSLNSNIWGTTLFVQFLILITIFIIFRKRINLQLLIVLLLAISSVPLMMMKNGIDSTLFLFDFIPIVIFQNTKIRLAFKKSKFIRFTLFVFIFYPILITCFSLIFDTNEIDLSKVFLQLYRYLTLFIILCFVLTNTIRIKKFHDEIINLIIFNSFLVSLFLILNFNDIINLDLWWNLKKYEVYENHTNIGKGGMFYYRASMACFVLTSLVFNIYKFDVTKNSKEKFFIILNLLILFIVLLYSGSKQGLFFALLVPFLYYRSINVIKPLLLTIICLTSFYFFVDDLDFTVKLKDYINQRFIEYFEYSSNRGIENTLVGRNQQLLKFNNYFDNTLFIVFGRGMGGKILKTESELINVLGFFGIFGLMTYIIWWIKLISKSMVFRKFKFYFPLILIAFLLTIQQWSLFTWYPDNANNNIIIMLFIGILQIYRSERKSYS